MSDDVRQSRRVEQMNEYRDVAEHTRVIRDNALRLDDLVKEMRWVAAGGRGAVDPEKFHRLVTGIRRTAEDLEELDYPNPYEVKDGD